MENCEDIVQNAIKNQDTQHGLELKTQLLSLKEKFQFLDPEA
jgi:hypothetical protein